MESKSFATASKDCSAQIACLLVPQYKQFSAESLRRACTCRSPATSEAQNIWYLWHLNIGFHGAMRLFICGVSVISPSCRLVLVWIRNSAFYAVSGLAVQLGWLRIRHMDAHGHVVSKTKNANNDRAKFRSAVSITFAPVTTVCRGMFWFPKDFDPRAQSTFPSRAVPPGKCGKTSSLTACCDSVNSSFRAKNWFAELTKFDLNGR